jgi:hypothetical protein
MRKKSLEQIVRPEDNEKERSGAFAALVHATGMRDRGHFSPAEARDLQRLFAQAFRDTPESDEFDARVRDGSYSQLEDLCGYADGEDPDEVTIARALMIITWQRYLPNCCSGAKKLAHRKATS